MGTGQMLLTIGGLMLMTTLVLRMNTAYFDSSVSLKQNNFDVVAASMATSYLETVKTKGFDQATITAAVYSLSSLSSQMKKESGESRVLNTISANATTFNDVDDFNGDVLYINVPSGSSTIPNPIFKIECRVEYYNPATNTVTTSQQWHKKISVTVSSGVNHDPNSPAIMTAPVTLSTIFSYWKFR